MPDLTMKLAASRLLGMISLLSLIPIIAGCDRGGPEADPLTPEALANGRFESSYVEAGGVELNAGKYEDIEARTVVLLPEGYTARGDLDGDGVDDAAVVLVSNTGGSGVFHDLLAVSNSSSARAVPNSRGARAVSKPSGARAASNPDGEVVTLATVFLGDRIQIQEIDIVEGQVVIDMITHGPEEPLCCPTLRVIKKYRLQGGALVENSVNP